MTTGQLWPRYAGPADLADVESVPLHERGLPDSTFEIVQRAASLWPDATAVTVLPDAAHWENGVSRTFGQLATDVRRTANLLRAIGVQRDSVVALLSPNCAGLITATLAAQLAGIAAPMNSGLSAEQATELASRSGARTLISASPEFDAASWDLAISLAQSGLIDAARHVFTDALAEHPGVRVDTHIEDGAPVLTVEISDPARRDDIDRLLGRYAVTYHLVASQ
jgi:fatty-acyl-CoA synthase